jgi:hypothetical protein
LPSACLREVRQRFAASCIECVTLMLAYSANSLHVG